MSLLLLLLLVSPINGSARATSTRISRRSLVASNTGLQEIVNHILKTMTDLANAYNDLLPSLMGCVGSVVGCKVCQGLTLMNLGRTFRPKNCLEKCTARVFATCTGLLATSVKKLLDNIETSWTLNSTENLPNPTGVSSGEERGTGLKMTCFFTNHVRELRIFLKQTSRKGPLDMFDMTFCLNKTKIRRFPFTTWDAYQKSVWTKAQR